MALKIETAAGGSLQCISILYNGMDIGEMGNVCDMPTLIPRSNWGNETYVPVLEPLTRFVNNGQRWGKDFDTVRDLVEDFTKFVEKYNAPEYSDTKCVEIEYCGYKYLWRPRHKTHYGTYTMYYFALPIIARYAFYCYPTLEIDHNSVAALPYKYKGKGTAKGLFNPDMYFDNPYGTIEEPDTELEERTVRMDEVYGFGMFTRLSNVTGFSRVYATARVGVQMFKDIDAALEELKGNGVTITKGAKFDNVSTPVAKGLGLLYYGDLPKDTGDLSAATPVHNSKVKIVYYRGTSEEEAAEAFEKVFPDMEVI